MHLDDPTFPPMFKGHAVKAPLTAEGEACRRAAAGELGAGDLVWSRNTAKAECALILEPEVSLAKSCQMAALGFVALAEAVGHVGPPQLPVEARWPGAVLVDGGVCGGITLIAPSRDAEAVPPWLVLSSTLTLTFNNDRIDSGHRDGATALDLQGAADVTRTAVIETLGTCLLAWLHTWGENGFRPIHDQWIFRAEGRDREVEVEGVRGPVLGLNEDGGLMLKTSEGRVVSRSYLPHVKVWG